MGTLPKARDIWLLYRKGRNEAVHREMTINADMSAILFFQSIFYGSCFVRFSLVKTTLHKSLSGLPTRLSAFPAPDFSRDRP